MAEFFRGQPLHLPEAAPQLSRRANLRKLSELPWQQTAAAAWDQLADTLSDLDFIEAKCEASRTQELLLDYQHAQERMPLDHPERSRLNEFQDFVARRSSVLRVFPDLAFQEASNQPDQSAPAREAAGRWRTGSVARSWLRWINKHQRAEDCNMLFTGHTALVSACDCRGDLVLSGDEDGRLLLWEAGSGEQLHEFRGHRDLISCCHFLGDGSTVASGSYDGTLRLWDRRTGQCLHVLRGHTDWVLCLDATVDGKVLVSGGGYSDATVRVWDVESGAIRFEWSMGDEAVPLCRVLRTEPACLASGDAGSLKKWHLETGALLGESRPTEAANECWDFCDDEARLIVGTSDGNLTCWDLPHLRPLAATAAHRGGVTSCCFLPNEKLVVSAGRDKHLKVWYADSLQLEATRQTHRKTVVWCGGSGRQPSVVSAGRDGAVAISRMDADERTVLEPSHSAAITCAVPAGTEQLVTGSADCSLRVWNLDHGRPAQSQHAHEEAVTCCDLLPDDSGILSGSSDGSLRVWPRDRGAPPRVLARDSGHIAACVWLPTGGCVTATRDGNLQFRDSTGALQHQTSSLTKGIVGLAASPDRRIFAVTGVDTRLVLWDATTRQPLRVILIHDVLPRGWVTSCAFTPDASHVWAAHRTRLNLFHVAAARPNTRLCGSGQLPAQSTSSGYSAL